MNGKITEDIISNGGFNAWVQKYNGDFSQKVGEGYDAEKESVAYRFEVINRYIKPNARVCDLGCGFGAFMLSAFKINDNLTIAGIDVSGKALTSCKENLKKYEKKVFLKLGNATKTDFPDNEFDVVVSSQLLEHLPEPKELIAEAFRICKVGGHILFTTPKESNILDKTHLHQFDYYNIYDLFVEHTDDFKVMELNKYHKESKANIWFIVARKVA